MTKLTLLTGGLLVLTGLVAFAATRTSVTALIPAFVGLPILLCGVIATRGERARRIGVHVALTIALVGALGSLRNVAQLGELLAGTATSAAPVVVSLVLLVVTLVYLVLGIRSFVLARRTGPAR